MERNLKDELQVKTDVGRDRAEMVAKVRTLAGILNKYRLSNSWSMLPVAEAEKMVGVWLELLDRQKIPSSAYDDLYFAAMDARSRAASQGKEIPDFNVNLLISCWIADNELRSRARQNVKSLETSLKCEFCNGTGWRPRMSGKYSTVMRCTHTEET